MEKYMRVVSFFHRHWIAFAVLSFVAGFAAQTWYFHKKLKSLEVNFPYAQALASQIGRPPKNDFKDPPPVLSAFDPFATTVQAQPKRDDHHFVGRAMASLKDGEVTDAAEAFMSALAENPRNEIAMSGLKECQSLLEVELKNRKMGTSRSLRNIFQLVTKEAKDAVEGGSRPHRK